MKALIFIIAMSLLTPGEWSTDFEQARKLANDQDKLILLNFAGYKQHAAGETYYTSDYDLSKFDSHFIGAGIRLVSPDGILGIGNFNTIEVRYGHYSRQTGLVSNIVSLNAKFK